MWMTYIGVADSSGSAESLANEYHLMVTPPLPAVEMRH